MNKTTQAFNNVAEEVKKGIEITEDNRNKQQDIEEMI